jgi:YD repeat-containing protein
VKRLQFATNPESGQIGYAYDANGNVKTRTDPRSVTTTYNYDALNRVFLKSYAGTPAAPNVTYCYDGQIAASQDGVCTAPNSSIPNSRGRLTQMYSLASTTTHGAYDGLGRVTQSSQFTGTTTYPFSYSYNAAGLLTSLVYPSGRTVTTGYDSAARPTQLGLGATATQYVSAVSYMPHGAINQLTFGTGGVLQTTTYDPQRLQPTNITGASSSGSLLTLGYGWCPASDCTKNNGNLASQKITVGSLVRVAIRLLALLCQLFRQAPAVRRLQRKFLRHHS